MPIRLPAAAPGGGRGAHEPHVRGTVWRVASPQTPTAGLGTTLALSSLPTYSQNNTNFASSEVFSRLAKSLVVPTVPVTLSIRLSVGRLSRRHRPRTKRVLVSRPTVPVLTLVESSSKHRAPRCRLDDRNSAESVRSRCGGNRPEPLHRCRSTRSRERLRNCRLQKFTPSHDSPRPSRVLLGYAKSDSP